MRTEDYQRRSVRMLFLGGALLGAFWLFQQINTRGPARAPHSTAVTLRPEPPREEPIEMISGVAASISPDASPTALSEVVLTPGIAAIEDEAPMIPPLAFQRGELPWEQEIRAIVTDPQKPDADKARTLLAALATLPAEGRAAAAEEAVKRLPDTDYAIAQPHVINAGTYGLALEVLFADLVERPDALRLPALLAIARNPAHPFAGTARDHLAHFFGTRTDADPVVWDAAIRARLTR
jgi:hypothetical protein